MLKCYKETQAKNWIHMKEVKDYIYSGFGKMQKQENRNKYHL